MKTVNMTLKTLIATLATVAALSSATPAQAGFKKWLEKEALPTVSGERKLQVKPYVKFSHKGNHVKAGPNSASANIGGIKFKTNKLQKRIGQGACMYATGGNAAACMPDVLRNESRRMMGRVYRGMQPNIRYQRPVYANPVNAYPLNRPVYGNPMYNRGYNPYMR